MPSLVDCSTRKDEREQGGQEFWKMVSAFTRQLGLNVHSANWALLISNQPLIYTHLVEKVHTWKSPVRKTEKTVLIKDFHFNISTREKVMWILLLKHLLFLFFLYVYVFPTSFTSFSIWLTFCLPKRSNRHRQWSQVSGSFCWVTAI